MAKAKARKTKGKPPKRSFPWFVWLAIGLGIVAIVAFVRTCPINSPTGSNNSGELKAAIIDQLYSFGYSNEDFIQQTTQELEDYGVEVDLYQGDEVTVDFYRKLPSLGYKLIIFRAHSGLIHADESKAIMKTCIFTNEPYNRGKHRSEQLKEEVAMARVSEGEPFYFAIGPTFITDSMKGQFHNTVIIVTGCSCLYLNDLAQAFIDKGASAYLAWDRTVDLDYVDEATMSLVENLCSEGFTLKKAVDLTMATKGPDPKYHATLRCYPAKSGDKTLKQLINP